MTGRVELPSSNHASMSYTAQAIEGDLAAETAAEENVDFVEADEDPLQFDRQRIKDHLCGMG